MNLRISDGFSEARVRLEARLTTGSFKDRQQTRFLIFFSYHTWRLAYCNEGAARGEYSKKIFQNDR
jgi:hypothetical protein